jgi:5-dehydro-4-deoxyglucarate dehydratase
MGIMNNPLLRRFPGVIGFPVTPFSAEGVFDADALKVNARTMMESGLAVLAFCGSNGELQSLTIEEYRQIADVAAGVVGGRKGLVFGVGQTLRAAQEQARTARRAGADAILLMAPYTSDANEPGLADYYRLVAEAAEIPVSLYQTKWSGVLPLSLLERLAKVENICMVKDEHGDLSHYLQVRRHFGERFFWINGMAEPFVPSYWKLGVTTFTSGLACFIPQITMEIFEAARRDDFARINQLLDEVVVPLYEIRNRRPGYKCSMIKTGMNLAGLKGGFVRPPLIELSSADRADLAALLEKVGALSSPGVTV